MILSGGLRTGNVRSYIMLLLSSVGVPYLQCGLRTDCETKVQGGWDFPEINPLLLIFSDSIGYFSYGQLNLIGLLFPPKSVLEIICPKYVGKIFQQNLSFDHFQAICTNFVLDF